MSNIDKARELLREQYDRERKASVDRICSYAYVSQPAQKIATLVLRLSMASRRLTGMPIEKVQEILDDLTFEVGSLCQGVDEHERGYVFDDNDKTLLLIDQHLIDEQDARHALSDRGVRVAVWKKTGGKCVYCKTKLRHPYEDVKESDLESPVMHVDHVVAKANGGPDHISNYAPSCASCNMAKSEKDVVDFISAVKKLA